MFYNFCALEYIRIFWNYIKSKIFLKFHLVTPVTLTRDYNPVAASYHLFLLPATLVAQSLIARQPSSILYSTRFYLVWSTCNSSFSGLFSLHFICWKLYFLFLALMLVKKLTRHQNLPFSKKICEVFDKYQPIEPIVTFNLYNECCFSPNCCKI